MTSIVNKPSSKQPPELARILVIARPELHPFYISLAKLLRDEQGSHVAIYFRDTVESERFKSKPEAANFNAVFSGHSIYKDSLEPVSDVEAIYAKGRALEAWLGVPINHLLQNDRHFGRGFALAGTNHPRSRYSENASYPQIINAVVINIEKWRDLFEHYRPTLIFNGDNFMNAVAARLSIPMRFVAGSRYGNYSYWSPNHWYDAPGLEEGFKSTHGAELPAETISTPYLSHLRVRNYMGHKPDWRRVARGIGSIVAKQVYWRIHGLEKAKGYFTGDNIRHALAHEIALRKLAGPRMARLKDLRGKRFVFFPLQTEPEASLLRLSPEFTSQLSAIATIARDLPVGVLLAVKDTHLALGRRPRDFYRQIEGFKNAVMLNVNEYGPEVVREAAAVAVISGTPGFEGAVMGKPVIAFGRHNIFNFLDHVWQVSDPTDMKPALDWALGPGFNAKQAQHDGAAFLSALHEMSFDMRDYDYINRKNLDPQSVRDAHSQLVASLNHGKPECGGADRDLTVAAS